MKRGIKSVNYSFLSCLFTILGILQIKIDFFEIKNKLAVKNNSTFLIYQLFTSLDLWLLMCNQIQKVLYQKSLVLEAALCFLQLFVVVFLFFTFFLNHPKPFLFAHFSDLVFQVNYQ